MKNDLSKFFGIPFVFTGLIFESTIIFSNYIFEDSIGILVSSILILGSFIIGVLWIHSNSSTEFYSIFPERLFLSFSITVLAQITILESFLPPQNGILEFVLYLILSFGIIFYILILMRILETLLIKGFIQKEETS